MGLGLGWLYPLPFVPTSIPRAWVGGGLFALGVALAVWAIVTIRRAGTQFDIRKPTTAIVENGPYGATRNPIYRGNGRGGKGRGGTEEAAAPPGLGMFLGQAGIAIGFDNLWVLAMLAPFYFVIRDGVVAREEAYLERKFGAVYRGYKSRVRRWL